MGKYEYIFWGLVYALLPALAFGLLAGIVFRDFWITLIVFAAAFGFGLDVIFGKGVECRTRYKK